MDVTIIGGGYVGLSLAGALLHYTTHRVTVVERNPARFIALAEGDWYIKEPMLDVMLESRFLHVHRKVSEVRLDHGKEHLFVLCVDTPLDEDTGLLDTSSLHAAARDLSAALNERLITDAKVAVRSTVPIGTTEAIAKTLGAIVHDSNVFHMPEFLQQGQAIEGLRKPDRIVLGTAAPRVENLHRSLLDMLLSFVDPEVVQEVPIRVMRRKESEAVKLASNAMLATRISFANSIASLMHSHRQDAAAVMQAVGDDRRIGPAFLRHGPGYGGSCLRKDTTTLNTQIRKATGTGSLDRTLEVNSAMAVAVVDCVTEAWAFQLGLDRRPESIAHWKIAVLGAAFKPGTPDTRDTPTARVCSELLRRFVLPSVHNPVPVGATLVCDGRAGTKAVSVSTDLDKTLEDSHAVIIMGDWPEYRLSLIGDTLTERCVCRILVDASGSPDREGLMSLARDGWYIAVLGDGRLTDRLFAEGRKANKAPF